MGFLGMIARWLITLLMGAGISEARAGALAASKLLGPALAVLMAGALFVAWLWRHDAKVEARAEAKVIERSVQAGKRANAEADKAHAAAGKPGAAERLRRKSCRDCAGI